MAEDNKRKRSPNWLPSEKALLLDLVEKHIPNIECKKTDVMSMKKKLREWDILAAKYNSRTSYLSRTADSLKGQWEHLKKMAKKEDFCNRMQQIQPGGRPANPKKEDPILRRVISLIMPSAFGLCNPLDIDGEVSVSEETVKPDPDAEILTQEMCIEDTNLIILNQIQDPNSGQTLLDAKNSESTSDWSDYTPTPVASQLHSNYERGTKPERSYISRRRPTPVTSPTLEQLRLKKIEAIDLQNDLARKEVEKADIIKDLDIEIKREILKQERIKTRILLLDLRLKKRQMK